MTHLRSLIHQALEDGLPPSERSRLDEHLQGCDSCRRFDAELRRNDDLLGRREALPPIPARRVRERRLLGAAGPLAVGFATVLLALGAGAQLMEWRTQNAMTPAAAPSSSPSAAVTPLPSEPMPSQSVVVSAGAPQCPAGEMPILDVTQPAPPGERPGSGSADAEAAFRMRYPSVTSFAMYPWGSDRSTTDVSGLRGPIWIVAGEETFVALAPGAADGSNNWFAYPAKFVGCRPPSPDSVRTWVAQATLDVDGYRFTVRVVTDPAYGPQPSAGPWAVSAVPGVGLACLWTRTGPDVGTVSDLWGTPASELLTVQFDDVRTGAGGNRVSGVPEDALHGAVATTLCGVRDAEGQHGVLIELTIQPDGRYTDSALRLSPWSKPLEQDASRSPIRWQLKQPIPYTEGAWTFAGFVENNFKSAARDINLEITLPSGEVLVHPIASRLNPGERTEYVFRIARPQIDGWKARARFQLSEWP